MNFNEACINLQISSPFSHEHLKKQYRIMALKYHPDKHQPDSDNYYNNKFKTIKESYDFLNSFLENKENNVSDYSDYNSIFSEFLSSFFSQNSSEVTNIINIIITDCQNLSLKLFEHLDKEKAIQIFEFINTYQHVLYISKETVDDIKDIVNKKIENDNIIIINPSLNDLLCDNVYILDFEEEKYYIPLWHDEVYFKNKKNDTNIVIKCIPELPENISLDNDNNLIINITHSISEIISNEHIIHNIGDFNYNIPVNELKIKKTQTYILKNQGISIIQPSNIYDNSKKGSVIFIIQLH